MPVTILPKPRGKPGRPRKDSPRYKAPKIEKRGGNGNNGAVTFKRILDLSPDHRLVLDTMFQQERGVAVIIKHFQQELKLWTDVSPTTLEKFLYRYKKEVVDPHLSRAMVSVNKQRGVIPLIHSKDDIDVLQEIGELVIAQKARVQKLLVREHDMPMLFNTLKAEMQALGGFVQQFAELSFDMGLIKRAPKTTKITNGRGEITTVESDGKDEVQVSIQQNQALEAAAQSFFNVIDGAFTDVSDKRTSS